MKSIEKQRVIAVTVGLCIIIAVGLLIKLIPEKSLVDPESQRLQWLDPQSDPRGHAQQLQLIEIRERFDQAALMLHAEQYEFAVAALERVLELSPDMPEAHVNMGYALLGLEQYEFAEKYFSRASLLKSEQVNAYYGWALALEGMGEMEGALGAIESYLHLSSGNDNYRNKAKDLRFKLKSKLRGDRSSSTEDSTENTDEAAE